MATPLVRAVDRGLREEVWVERVFCWRTAWSSTAVSSMGPLPGGRELYGKGGSDVYLLEEGVVLYGSDRRLAEAVRLQAMRSVQLCHLHPQATSNPF